MLPNYLQKLEAKMLFHIFSIYIFDCSLKFDFFIYLAICIYYLYNLMSSFFCCKNLAYVLGYLSYVLGIGL